MTDFNENSRVKIPAILHLVRLGYKYLSLSKCEWDKSTNIFTDIFNESLQKLNPGITERGLKSAFTELSIALDNEDLGKRFYEMIISPLPVKYIDFENFHDNTFHVVTELPYIKNNEEFRPDITLLINGMPLAFIEVKKPNNKEGILAERNRMNRRFSMPKFRQFMNISQILVFTNNMEYDADTAEPLQGSFYATTSDKEAKFNFFREEQDYNLFHLKELDDSIEKWVLKDTNNVVIKSSPEFATNKNPLSPANRILTSLFYKDRLRDLLLYGLVYVNGEQGLEKHIMRYPQFFATKAIEATLKKDIKKGIIWHTQGSGKTALAYFNVRYLIEYYSKHKQTVPKFYFVVDRIDLAGQATTEFENRGLAVLQVQSKDDFKKSICGQAVIENDSGKPEITVVNIQKFSDDSRATRSENYNLNVQRIYFLDEVHRSYNPTGSFLANLMNSDKDAVFIGLTGTPLIGKDRKSRDIFGDYIHKYYYNSSIADGYTLKLIREEIETQYKVQLRETIKSIQVLQQDIDKSQVYAHKHFAGAMLDYIVEDLKKSRIRLGDDSIGGMVVCDSAQQARMMFEIFQRKYLHLHDFNKKEEIAKTTDYLIAAEPEKKKKPENSLSAALILHDEGSKSDRKIWAENFKYGEIDILFVYNMLLTGFDAKRLKKLYLGRVIKDHNLLQTLTRVNRPYKNHKYGYVVDFADISKEFDKTNKAYFDELQNELGDDLTYYNNLFKQPHEIEEEIAHIKEVLFYYDTRNAEKFSQQISEIQDRKDILEIKNALQAARELYNLIRLLGYDDLLEKMDFGKLKKLLNVASDHLNLLNQKEALENQIDTYNLLNMAMEEIYFLFRKINESELILADQLKNRLQRTREAMANNFDKKDPEFVNLYEALKKVFDRKNLDEVSQEEMNENITSLNYICEQIAELNRRNRLLREKYDNDAKYARIHKRLKEKECRQNGDVQIGDILNHVKHNADDMVLINNNLLNNENYFRNEMTRIVIESFMKNHIHLDAQAAQNISLLITNEYMIEYRYAG